MGFFFFKNTASRLFIPILLINVIQSTHCTWADTLIVIKKNYDAPQGFYQSPLCVSLKKNSNGHSNHIKV